MLYRGPRLLLHCCHCLRRALSTSAVGRKSLVPHYPVAVNTLDRYGRPMDIQPVDRSVWRTIKEESQLFKQEMTDTFTKEYVEFIQIGDMRKEFSFESEEKLAGWQLVSDRSRGQGYSQCQLQGTPQGKAVFSGVIDTRVPRTGTNLQLAGYCNMTTKRRMRSFARYYRYDWTNYSHLVVRCRGDGRTYMLLITCLEVFDQTHQDAHAFPLFTRGGPFWQVTKIPFSRFAFMSSGALQDSQSPPPLHKVTTLGITAAGHPGPFRLELDYIGLERSQAHREFSAYETYRTPMGVAY